MSAGATAGVAVGVGEESRVAGVGSLVDAGVGSLVDAETGAPVVARAGSLVDAGVSGSARAEGPTEPRRYPVLLDLVGRAVLVVGGGPVAARRALGLVQSGARVHIVAPKVCEDLVDLVATGAVTWWPREAATDDLRGPSSLGQVGGVGTGGEEVGEVGQLGEVGQAGQVGGAGQLGGAGQVCGVGGVGTGGEIGQVGGPVRVGALTAAPEGAVLRTSPGTGEPAHGGHHTDPKASADSQTVADAGEPAQSGHLPGDHVHSNAAPFPGAPLGTAAPARPDPADRWWLVHTATGDRLTDSAIATEADRQGIWCVRADRAELSAAHTPAVAHGPDGVQIAVSGGGDPGRARAIRDAISDLLAAGALPLRRSRTAGPVPADSIQVRGPSGPGNLDEPSRAQLELGSIDPGGAAGGGRVGGGRRHPERGGAGTGRVVLVGGGPGDPGLLTVAGRQWLARADVVVADRLGPVEVLTELDPCVQIIDVGKSAGHHPIPQDEINRLLVEHAHAGRVVVRLKGGDPFVLGRGGEEALHCRAHGVPVEVVPGVTSAISVPAAAGIPVTHRGITTSVVIASAHAGAGPALEAAQHAPADATVVLLMGLSALAPTAAELVAAGRDAATPVAVISRGWTPGQRTVTGTLDTIAAEVATAELPGPVIIVVGEVVGLRARIGDLAGRAGGSDRRGRVTIG